MYCLKTSYDYSEQLLPKQIQSEKQKMNNRITSYKVEYSKKQNQISELQTMRRYLMLKEQQLKNINKKTGRQTGFFYSWALDLDRDLWTGFLHRCFSNREVELG